MKKVLAIGLVLIMCFALVACGSDDEGGIVGKWLHDGNSDEYMTFTSDGKCIVGDSGNEVEFTYEVDGNKLTLDFNGRELVSEYKISGNTLTIIDPDGTTMELTKAK